MSPQFLLHWHSKGGGWVRVAEGWPRRCCNVLGPSCMVVVPLNSSPDLNYVPAESNLDFSLLRWHPDVNKKLVSKKIPTRWQRWPTNVSRKAARCKLVVLVCITCIIAMSGRPRSGCGYYYTKCCKNTVLLLLCCLEEHYKITSIRPETANGCGGTRRLLCKGRKESSQSFAKIFCL